jgi:predicted AAA+ superfamily ATPase
MNLSAMGAGKFEVGKTLVFFDEIQSCPNARTAIKFLVEDGRFDYIESGSLLGINYKEVSSFPVGFEISLKMFPLDFEEFLWAKNISADVVAELRNSYTNSTPVTNFLHEQISSAFREFLVVGGMPEAVQKFVQTHNFLEIIEVQESIINSYRDDIAKYAGSEKHRAKKVFDAIASQLGKENKRFILSQIEQGAGQREYVDASQWLGDAGIAYHCYNLTALELPFSSFEKKNLYKLYSLDTGLLCALSRDNIQWEVLKGDLNVNTGALSENAIAAVLAAKQIPLFYYDKKSRLELDFIVKENNKIAIIEVKSGNSYKNHPSLTATADKFQKNLSRCAVFCKGNVEKKSNITYYPLYMSMFL